jgi:hypothetical protein
MAAVDAQKRADDVIAKYRKSMDDWSQADGPDSPAEFDAIATALRDDIINAINAAVNEVRLEADKAIADAKAKADAKLPPEPRAPRPQTTHMPATGHDKPAASARK